MALPIMSTTSKQDPSGSKKKSKGIELETTPDFVQHRMDVFDRLQAEYTNQLASKPRNEITVTLPNGHPQVGRSWETTPASIAMSLSKSLYERSVVALVDGEAWDLDRPLEKSCKLELLDFEHPDGKKVFWHSSAHVLGEAAERRLGCLLCNGPPTEEPPGFYYDMANLQDVTVKETDKTALEELVGAYVKEKQPFERLSMSKADLLEMFKYSKYKTHFINQRVPDGTESTVYRCGTLIDLCRGPHVQHTAKIKAFAVLRNSSSYWLGDSNNETLQRISGISFPSKKLLDDYKNFVEEAARRDHRKIGKDQKLFFFDDVSPGSCFFLPHGTRIYNAMLNLLKEEYSRRDYDEVITPNMYKSDLWKVSGHWNHYEENMFTFDIEKERFGLKPMNCPGHCKIFKHSDVSYRNLPWRMADFGVIHRNEFSGALTGLTRVRRFQQDDAHIFCTEEQIAEEIRGIFDFIHTIYGLFGFRFKLKLSTRPGKYLGDLRTWDEAETKLKQCLDSFTKSIGASWEEKPGDGAFYGPKIDIELFDALQREHQCGTIQLDFQLPQQFNLRYVAKEDSSTASTLSEDVPAGYARPVMIHRAIFGSFERMFAVLTEHFAGKWPFWLSPRQVLVIPVMTSANDYAAEVQRVFKERGMYVDVDLSDNTLKKKIRTGQLEQYNFIFVVGAEEQASRTVNIRNRDDQSTHAKGDLIALEEAINHLVALKAERRLLNKF